MKRILNKKAKSPRLVAYSTLLILIFITAMKYPAEKKSYTYLALGDSYTIGEQVLSKENFPNQVYQLLTENKIKVKAPTIVAKTGWTTDELQGGINKANLGDKYDFVSLLIGVNNQYRGWGKKAYTLEFEFLLKQAIQFAGNDPSHVIVLSIPDWGITPFAAGKDRSQIAREIDEFNAINKEIAISYNVNYVDITPDTRKAAEDPSLLAPDGLHPSGKEYAKWAGIVAGIIKKHL